MNRKSLFENSECRRLFAAFAALTALFVLFTLVFSLFSIHQLEARLVQRESAVAGRLIAGKTFSADEVAGAFSASDDAKYAAAGAAAFEKTGYTEETAGRILPFLNSGALQFIGASVGAAMLLFLLLCASCYLFARRVYCRVEEAGRQAARISRGDYGVRLKDGAEGAFARMNHAFNEMSAGVSAGLERLGRERLFLQNLISDISHQLKTPLAALKMYNEILLQENLSDTALDFTKKSTEQLDRMEWLILGLLKMARIEAGSVPMDLRQNSLTKILEETLSDFSLSAAEKKIRITLVAEDSPMLRCDAGWLKEALENVIKNCMEYTPPGGQITVRAEQTPVMVSIRISDTGAGIHPDDLPYVFRRFYRGRGSRNSGSGIGLCLSKSLTEQMGGTLCAGGIYGSGAEFTFSFLKDVI